MSGMATNTVRDRSALYWMVANVSMEESCTDAHFVKVLYLLRAGADPNHNEGGQSVLIACANMRCGYYDWSIAHLLIEWGADPHFLYEDKNAAQWIDWRAGFGAEELQSFIDNYAPTARSARAIERARIV